MKLNKYTTQIKKFCTMQLVSSVNRFLKNKRDIYLDRIDDAVTDALVRLLRRDKAIVRRVDFIERLIENIIAHRAIIRRSKLQLKDLDPTMIAMKEYAKAILQQEALIMDRVIEIMGTNIGNPLCVALLNKVWSKHNQSEIDYIRSLR